MELRRNGKESPSIEAAGDLCNPASSIFHCVPGCSLLNPGDHHTLPQTEFCVKLFKLPQPSACISLSLTIPLLMMLILNSCLVKATIVFSFALPQPSCIWELNPLLYPMLLHSPHPRVDFLKWKLTLIISLKTLTVLKKQKVTNHNLWH